MEQKPKEITYLPKEMSQQYIKNIGTQMLQNLRVLGPHDEKERFMQMVFKKLYETEHLKIESKYSDYRVTDTSFELPRQLRFVVDRDGNPSSFILTIGDAPIILRTPEYSVIEEEEGLEVLIPIEDPNLNKTSRPGSKHYLITIINDQMYIEKAEEKVIPNDKHLRVFSGISTPIEEGLAIVERCEADRNDLREISDIFSHFEKLIKTVVRR